MSQSFLSSNQRRNLLVLMGVAAAALVPAAAQCDDSLPRQRPNIVLVLADQWRAQALGCAGDPNVKTPNLDRLARQAAWFRNAVSSMPVCCPARASLMTGQRVLTHGVFLNDVPLSPDAVTLPKVLAAAGYDTAMIGKWHLNANGRSNFIPPERRQGFSYWKALECTHDYNHSFYYADGPEKFQWEGYDAIAQTRDAQQYLRDHARLGRPFFLFLSWGPPHDPYLAAPKKYRDMYRAAGLKLRPNIPESLQRPLRTQLAGYYAHCTALDDCFGQLCDTLKTSNLQRDTIVIFASDHGDMLGAHGGWCKQQPYDESIRVPLLILCPATLGIAVRQLDAPITLEDLMPTLLGLCGLPVPKSVEGLDYSGLLRGGKDPSDQTALMSCVAPFGQWNRAIGGREYRGIRTPRYTYVRDLKGPWLLFDNRADPYQMENLVARPEHARLQADLDALLRRKLRDTRDDFLPGADYIAKWGYHVDANGTVPYTW